MTTALTHILSDLKHGARVLIRTPLFTICTIAALTKATKDPDSQVREKAVAGLVLLGMRR